MRLNEALSLRVLDLDFDRNEIINLADGWGSVVMPGALAGKFPNASKEFKWQWLFPQKNRWTNSKTGEQGRWRCG